MSDPCFIGDLADDVAVGHIVTLTGSEAHHAAAVRRIEVGESVLVTDGAGHAVRGPATAVDRRAVEVEVVEVLQAPVRAHRWVAVQALAKGDRADLAVETLTELGVDEILAWQAARSISRWTADKRDKGVARWQSTAREATKQSRRFTVPSVGFVTTKDVVARIVAADRAFVLHESATTFLAPEDLPDAGEVLFVVGPEGGVGPEELAAFTDAGARPTLVSDGVLRTSTAGVVGLAQLQMLAGLAAD